MPPITFEGPAEPLPVDGVDQTARMTLTATGEDYAAAREQLYAQVPDGWRLLSIRWSEY